MYEKGDIEDEEETGSGSRAVCRGSVLENEAQLMVQVGVQGEPFCGSSSKRATVFSLDPAERGPSMEATDGEDRLGNRGQSAGKVVKGGGFGLGPIVPKVGPVLGEAQFRSGLGGESYKSTYEVAQVHGPVDVRPIILKGWQLGCEERPFYIKGSFVGYEGMSEMETMFSMSNS